jgi:ABC-type branched-subunit amino acid transport system substrate-binding protein
MIAVRPQAAKFTRSLACLALLLLPGDGLAPLPARAARLARSTGPVDDVPAAAGLTQDERHGKKIYLDGSSATGGVITATLGQASDAVPASFVACGNCHGREGIGRTEAGIAPPDLSWRSLARVRVDQGSERRGRPAYNPALLGRAITMGIDPSGNRLGVGMPRYQITPRDLDDLIAYLRVLGTEPAPGILPETIRIATLLPPPGSAQVIREIIAGTLRAAVADLNERGGIYQRRVELESFDLADSTLPVADILKRRSPFALVAPYTAGREDDLARVFRQEGVPVIGPFSSSGPTAEGPDREIFFIEPDLATQSLALIEGGASGTPAIVRGDDPALSRVADLAATRWASLLGVEPSRFVIRQDADPATLDRLVAELARLKTDILLYLGPPSVSGPLVVAADRASWHPRFLAPSALWGRGLDVPPEAGEVRISLAFPRLPDDLKGAGRIDLDRLRSRHGLTSEHEAIQLAVLTAFKILEEGLRRSGFRPTRAGLIEELSRLEEFETGFSRPITFGPTRRVGSAGAYLMTLDRTDGRFRPVGWIPVRELR